MRKLFFLFLSLCSTTAFSYQHGATLSYVIFPKDPTNLHGIRAAYWFQPESWIWKSAQIYIDTSAGHWWITSNSPNHSLNSIAVAPVLRYYLQKVPTISPYVEFSIGPSYLSRTRIDGRNLGMHFAFQDQLGIGMTYGKEERFYSSISVLHYSNGSLCRWNAGITVPIMLNLGYKFN
ncbi:hypothetical protein AYO45_06395 [Gammaproteobacteria bacterium SCGC AG-212-F23]|nr:hypothetical protein AYO45_06395 [Gammaproteobacteria bacterium SCGC AG-212-F23]